MLLLMAREDYAQVTSNSLTGIIQIRPGGAFRRSHGGGQSCLERHLLQAGIHLAGVLNELLG